jgi:hypothetical protein
MRHFFYAVYVLFYTGAVFMGGMFVGQLLERARIAREQSAHKEVARTARVIDPKVAVMGKRE